MNRILRIVKSASNASSLIRALDIWRSASAFLNEKRNVIRGAAPDADRFRKQAEALKNARQLIREQRKRLERKDRKIEKQAEARKHLRQPNIRKQKRNLRRHSRQRIQQIKTRLYNLGFTDRALEDLQSLVADDSNPVLQRLAAWELSLWYANQYSKEGARQSLELLPVALHGENDPVQLRQAAIVESECQKALGNLEAAKLAISRALELGPHAELFLAYANLEASASAQIEWVNRALELHRIPKISFDASAGLPLLDSLRPGQDERERVEVSSDTKVSVIIPVYNAEDVIQTALDSVLSQTWTNLEVLVVDDCSTDATVPVVENYVSRDPRVQLIRAKSNGGTYVARNLALRVATGTFVTCHDADDWSHPEKIEKQARHLLGNPLVIGNTSQQARTTAELRFHRRGHHGNYVFNNMSAFMFRREPVMEAVGYWDCVRYGADNEFIRRVRKVFGDESVVNEPTGPLSFLRYSNSSLTGGEAFGYHGHYMGARKEYLEIHTHFHDTAENLRYEFPQHGRPFAVPEPMWPTREVKKDARRHFDVILASDFRLPGSTTSSNVEEIKAQKRMGLRTGLIQMPCYDLDPYRTINHKVRELLDGDRVQMLVYGEKASCDTLILRHLPILQEWQQFVPDVEAANVHVIVNQTPRRLYGDEGSDEGKLVYSISRCEEHLQKNFGKAGVWHPIGPLIRGALYQHHAENLTEITLADEDWSEIIDVDEWRRETRPPRGPKPRIGRHSRDQDVKWPVDPKKLLAIYPDSADYEVHVLGGAEAPSKVLGGLPENWHVSEFGEVHPKVFLSTLDVFVYYPHPDWVEAFGRVIIEAMAAGVPAILPHRFQELFKEAAIYAEPSEVKWNINRLMVDDDYYESRVRIARDYVEEHFSYTLHAKRLRKHSLSRKQSS
jgi:glycosyltransferase involved in cell wall biosynthesis